MADLGKVFLFMDTTTWDGNGVQLTSEWQVTNIWAFQSLTTIFYI